MEQEILALLIAQFAGMRKDGLAQMARVIAFQATTKDEAKELVEKVTKAHVDNFIKDYRADVDKEVSESNKTYESNLKKKFDFKEKGTDPGKDPDPTKPDPNDIQATITAAITNAMKPLQDELASFKGSKIAETRLQTLSEKLNGCKDETFKAKVLKDFGRMNLSDDQFNEYLTETETDVATANQNMADSELGGQGKPFFAQKGEDGVSAGVAQYLDSKKTEGNVLSGKEV